MPKHHLGKVLALDSHIADAGIDLDDFYPALLNVNRYGDQLFGLPIGIGAARTTPAPPWTPAPGPMSTT